jgi:hypothetical protein
LQPLLDKGVRSVNPTRRFGWFFGPKKHGKHVRLGERTQSRSANCKNNPQKKISVQEFAHLGLQGCALTDPSWLDSSIEGLWAMQQALSVICSNSKEVYNDDEALEKR